MTYNFIEKDLIITDETGTWIIPSINIKKWCIAYVKECKGKNISKIYKILREVNNEEI